MAKLPWRNFTTIDNEQTYVAMLTYLPLKHYRNTPRFFRYISMVYRQLMISPGLVSLSMQAHPLTRKYWTLSVWKDETAIHNFVSTKPHKDIMKQMSGNMEQTSFKSWQVHGGDLPLDWKKSIEQLA